MSSSMVAFLGLSKWIILQILMDVVLLCNGRWTWYVLSELSTCIGWSISSFHRNNQWGWQPLSIWMPYGVSDQSRTTDRILSHRSQHLNHCTKIVCSLSCYYISDTIHVCRVRPCVYLGALAALSLFSACFCQILASALFWDGIHSLSM